MPIKDVTAKTRTNDVHKSQIRDYFNDAILPYLADDSFSKTTAGDNYMKRVMERDVTLSDEQVIGQATYYQLDIAAGSKSGSKPRVMTVVIETQAYTDHKLSENVGAKGRYFIYPRMNVDEANVAHHEYDQALRVESSSSSSRESSPASSDGIRPSFVAAKREKVEASLNSLFAKAAKTSSSDRTGADAADVTRHTIGAKR